LHPRRLRTGNFAESKSSSIAIGQSADEIGLNPFETPVGVDGQRVMSPEKWVNNIREWLRLFWLNEPSINLLCEILLG
jgi:hypothetical protein